MRTFCTKGCRCRLPDHALRFREPPDALLGARVAVAASSGEGLSLNTGRPFVLGGANWPSCPPYLPFVLPVGIGSVGSDSGRSGPCRLAMPQQ